MNWMASEAESTLMIGRREERRGENLFLLAYPLTAFHTVFSTEKWLKKNFNSVFPMIRELKRIKKCYVSYGELLKRKKYCEFSWKLFPHFFHHHSSYLWRSAVALPTWKANENLSSFLFSALFPLPCSFPPLGNYGFLIWAKGRASSSTLQYRLPKLEDVSTLQKWKDEEKIRCF